MIKTILLCLISVSTLAYAKSETKRIFSSSKSACQVKQVGGGDGGDYPTFEIFKNKKALAKIDCDCSVSVLFSPSGKYIAFGNSEMDSFERKGNLMIYNCETGAKKTYIAPGCSKESGAGVCNANYAVPKKWSEDEKSLIYKNYSDGKDHAAKLRFDDKNSLP